MSRFMPLFSLTITHAFYGGACPDFAYLVPPDTARLLEGCRLLARPQGGRLVVLFEADDAGQPLARAAGRTIRIGLTLTNPHFANFTALTVDPARVAVRYDNEADPRQLAGPAPVTLDFDLRRQGVVGVVDVRIDDGLYAAAADLSIAFDAKPETLKYYLVARNYSDADVGQLTVLDAGFTEEARPEVTFTKVDAAAFTPEEIPAAALVGGGAGVTVLLFKSQAAVARRAGGRKKIQLKKNAEILVKHLPHPSPHSATADVIVHVSKP